MNLRAPLPISCAVLIASFAANADTLNFNRLEADSVADFSGVQGQGGWSYGWRNYTADGGGEYDPDNHFIPFTSGEWRNPNWRLVPSSAPWTFIADQTGHPNGTNSAPTEEHWAIRRYTVQPGVQSNALLRWNLAAQNINGTGTTLNVYRNGALIDTGVTSTATGVSGTVDFTNLAVGDVIDFALTPVGTDGSRSDGSDGSFFGGSISSQFTFETIGVIANSRTEFSGAQGQNNWTYGFLSTFSNNQPGLGDLHGGTFNQYAGGEGGGAWNGTDQFWTGSMWDSNNERHSPGRSSTPAPAIRMAPTKPMESSGQPGAGRRPPARTATSSSNSTSPNPTMPGAQPFS